MDMHILEPHQGGKKDQTLAKHKPQGWYRFKFHSYTKGLFGYHLFCWNWKLIVESIVDKGKS